MSTEICIELDDNWTKIYELFKKKTEKNIKKEITDSELFKGILLIMTSDEADVLELYKRGLMIC